MNRQIPRQQNGIPQNIPGNAGLSPDEITFVVNVLGENAAAIASIIDRALQVRRNSIRYLKKVATKCDEMSRASGGKALAPCGCGVVGGLANIGAGAVTIATGGAAVPIITALTCFSAGLGVVGGLWNVYNNVNEVDSESTQLKTLEDIIEQDLEATQELEISINTLVRKKTMKMENMIRDAQIALNVLSTANCFGSQRALEVLAAMQSGIFCLSRCKPEFLKSLLTLFGASAKPATTVIKAVLAPKEKKAPKGIKLTIDHKAIDDIAQIYADDAVKKKHVEGFTKYHATNVAYVAALNKLKRKAVEEIEEVGTKKVAKAIGRNTFIVAKEAADEAADGVLKTASKITGGVTVGYGAITMVWEGRNTYKAYQKSVARTSPLGDCLREIADQLQESLDSISD